jgi:hypothetical protein
MPEKSTPEQGPQNESRLPRRFLLGGSAVVAAAGLAELMASPAEAASATTTWKLGGNPAVTATNYLGTNNVAALIFKTTATTGGVPTERMRIMPSGNVGIAKTNPSARLDVNTSAVTALRSTTTSTSTSAVAVSGVSTSGIGVSGTSTNSTGVSGTSTNTYGLQGTSGYAGLRSDGQSYGAIAVGSASGSIGCYGSGSGYGLYGVGGTYGAFGNGSTYGLYGSGPTGVYGSGSVGGVTGTTTNVNGNAVYGTGGQYGVHGENARTAGVRGDSGYVGVWGQGTTYAMYALATDAGTNQTYGVFGQASNAASFGIWSQGNCHVAGTLSKTAGSFKIDHPLDPEHQWLSHSFVESPDMMNVYNGNVTLDANGEATVTLPAYFGALNRDFRYQLTCIGGHAPVYVSAKVKANKFSIAGGAAGLEVSWQVTGIRQDAYAKEHPIVVETPKSSNEKGTRGFVPKGSTSTLMRVGPDHPAAQPAVKHEAPLGIPALR